MSPTLKPPRLSRFLSRVETSEYDLVPMRLLWHAVRKPSRWLIDVSKAQRLEECVSCELMVRMVRAPIAWTPVDVVELSGRAEPK